MNILILDTSCEHEIVIVTGSTNSGGFFPDTGFVHSKSLFERIDTVLSEASLTITDLDAIVCGEGPGSFTGVRIAMVTARTIAQLIKKPLYAVRSHLLYAMQDSIRCGEYIVIAFDAKKGRVFGALYQKHDVTGVMSVVVEEGDYPIGQLLKKVPPTVKLICIGSGCVRYREEIEAAEVIAIFKEEYQPEREMIIDLCKDIVDSSPKKQELYLDVLPFYARKSDAEVLKNLKNLSS